jgi:hypothetical protein
MPSTRVRKGPLMANDSYSGVAVGLLPNPFDKATKRSKEIERAWTSISSS